MRLLRVGAAIVTAALAPVALVMVNACVIVRIADSQPEITAEAGLGDATDATATDAAAPDADGGPTLNPAVDLATSQQTPAAMVLDATDVYWLNLASPGSSATILRLPKGAAAGTAPGIFLALLSEPRALCADSTSVYVTSRVDSGCFGSGKLQKQPKSGAAGTQLASSCNIPFLGCAVHAGIVYWAAVNGAVASVRDDGTALATVAAVAGARLVVADGAHVYVGTTNEIMMTSNVADAGDVVVFANAPAVAALAIDATTVFWVDSKGVHKLGTNAPGGAVIDLALAQDGASAIALDETNVYWTTSGDGTVKSTPKSGGPITVLSKGEGDPRGIAVDATGIYWTNYGDGRVRVIRR